MLDDDYIYSWTIEKDRERKIKRKKREIYNHIRVFNAVINTFACTIALTTGNKTFYIISIACCISNIILIIKDR